MNDAESCKFFVGRFLHEILSDNLSHLPRLSSEVTDELTDALRSNAFCHTNDEVVVVFEILQEKVELVFFHLVKLH